MKKNYGELSQAELIKVREDLKEEIRKFRFDQVLSAIDNPHKKKNLRKDIARINTILNEYKLGIRKEQ